MAKVNVLELKQRLCAIEQESLLTLDIPIDSAAYPRWFVKAETFPYWINRITTVRALEGVDDYGEELSLYQYTVATRLVIGHITADYEGEAGEALDVYLPTIIEYLDARELLQSEQQELGDFTLPMNYLIRAHFVQATGFMVLPASPGGAQQIGAEFQWDCEFNMPLVQAYL